MAAEDLFREQARAERAEAELEQYRARLAARLTDEPGLSWPELLNRADQVVAERDALKAVIERVRERLDSLIADGFGATTPTLRDVRAVLATPTTEET